MENLLVGLRLTVYGMGIVFLLLGVLAVIIGGLVRLDRPKATERRGRRSRGPPRRRRRRRAPTPRSSPRS